MCNSCFSKSGMVSESIGLVPIVVETCLVGNRILSWRCTFVRNHKVCHLISGTVTLYIVHFLAWRKSCKRPMAASCFAVGSLQAMLLESIIIPTSPLPLCPGRLFHILGHQVFWNTEMFSSVLKHFKKFGRPQRRRGYYCRMNELTEDPASGNLANVWERNALISPRSSNWAGQQSLVQVLNKYLPSH
jgi:hypothetical protein